MNPVNVEMDKLASASHPNKGRLRCHSGSTVRASRALTRGSRQWGEASHIFVSLVSFRGHSIRSCNSDLSGEMAHCHHARRATVAWFPITRRKHAQVLPIITTVQHVGALKKLEHDPTAKCSKYAEIPVEPLSRRVIR